MTSPMILEASGVLRTLEQHQLWHICTYEEETIAQLRMVGGGGRACSLQCSKMRFPEQIRDAECEETRSQPTLHSSTTYFSSASCEPCAVLSVRMQGTKPTEVLGWEELTLSQKGLTIKEINSGLWWQTAHSTYLASIPSTTEGTEEDK